MRDNVKENKILDEAFFACAKVISNQLIHRRSEEKISAVCEEISSAIVSDYLKLAFELIDCAYVPEYIDVLLEYEYQKIDKSTITLDELKTLVILNKIITRVFQKKDFDFFYNFYSHECNSTIRDQLSLILDFQ